MWAAWETYKFPFCDETQTAHDYKFFRFIPLSYPPSVFLAAIGTSRKPNNDLSREQCALNVVRSGFRENAARYKAVLSLRLSGWSKSSQMGQKWGHEVALYKPHF